MAEESIPKRDPIEAIKQRAADVQRRQEQRKATAPQQLFLPGMEDFLRAMPNQIARSSLFAPIARGTRKFHKETPLVTRTDAAITYTGEQLDEADADLSLQLIYESRLHQLGQPVTLNRAALLRATGRSTGKNDYDWLHRRMKALTVATLIIEARKSDGSTKYRIGHTEAFHIVQSFRYDDESETYIFTLDPRWAVLFQNREYALLDWDKRLQLGRDMAKALQRLVATSSNQPQRYNLLWLKDKMQYSGRMRDFKDALAKAADELEHLGIIASSKLEESTKGNEQFAIWVAMR